MVTLATFVWPGGYGGKISILYTTLSLALAALPNQLPVALGRIDTFQEGYLPTIVIVDIPIN